MILRNKKTGKIITSKELLTDEFIIDLFSRDFDYFNSRLHKIEDEWEKYEEPNSWWYIDCNGEVFRGENADKEHTEEHKSIGNYYTSSKEAKQAVKKLKAWKRLKDKGFRFRNWYWDKNGMHGFISFSIKSENIDDKDIDLLFGGER